MFSPISIMQKNDPMMKVPMEADTSARSLATTATMTSGWSSEHSLREKVPEVRCLSEVRRDEVEDGVVTVKSTGGEGQGEAATTTTTTTKRRITKLEKINQLRTSNRSLKEENKSLRVEMRELRTRLAAMESALQKATSSSCVSCDSQSRPGGPSIDRGNSQLSLGSSQVDEKVVEAMNALKTAAVRQEESIRDLRFRLKRSKVEISARDEIIAKLEKERTELRKEFKDALGGDWKKYSDSRDIRDELLRSRDMIDDLELQCKEKTNRNRMLALQLDASEAKARSLQGRLDSIQKKQNQRDNASSSTDSSSSDGDSRQSIASSCKIQPSEALEQELKRVKEELSIKTERITQLETEVQQQRVKLDKAKTQIQEGTNDSSLKKIMEEAFPHTEKRFADFFDDFFSDSDNDEDLIEDDHLWLAGTLEPQKDDDPNGGSHRFDESFSVMDERLQGEF